MKAVQINIFLNITVNNVSVPVVNIYKTKILYIAGTLLLHVPSTHKLHIVFQNIYFPICSKLLIQNVHSNPVLGGSQSLSRDSPFRSFELGIRLLSWPPFRAHKQH